ncbi:MAG: UvrD-helicase domain-containing protein [Proteobacteria bacterium]|nr:UvrD-helicase domain-containing protein [Pseudomonadota bacterium]
MLNPQQLLAVKHLHSPLLVLAGAGCGKTRVITEKMCYLLQSGFCQAESIYAITFTNKAARQMQQRAIKMMAVGSEINISTFHSLGLKIIQQEIKHSKYHAGFSILDTSESFKILQELMPKGIKKELVSQLQWQISGWKSAGLTPEQSDSITPMAIEVYQQYCDHLIQINAVDFDDLILQPLLLLRNNGEIRQRWQNKMAYLLIDEYQDTNASQYQLIKQLIGNNPGISCVGDDDQSIYGWRGAQPENLQLLQKDFVTLEVIKLEQNYRSSSTILGAANALIQKNPHPIVKKIWSDLGTGSAITVQAYDQPELEAQRVANDIHLAKIANNMNFANFAILYRSNHQAKTFEQVFRLSNLPYQISGGRSFFDFAEIKDMMAYVRLLANPRDNSAFLRIINVPKRGVGVQTVRHISALAKPAKLSFFQACQQPAILGQLNTKSREHIKVFVQTILHHQRLKLGAGQIIASLFSQIDYQSWVNISSNNKMAKINKGKLVKDFLKWIKALDKKNNMSLEDMLAYLSLQNNPEDNADSEDSIKLMTLHAAKGLEFSQVYLVGVEEGILPHRNSIESIDTDLQNDIGLQEERRLMYVGMTRAMHQLKISYVTKRKSHFAGQDSLSNGPSRFIDEIPAEFIAGTKQNTSNQKLQKKTTKQHLAALKAMLD